MGGILTGQGEVSEFYYTTFRKEATPALMVGPLFWLNWNLEVLVKFQDNGSFARKGRRPEPTTNSTEIYNYARIEPRQNCWEATTNSPRKSPNSPPCLSKNGVSTVQKLPRRNERNNMEQNQFTYLNHTGHSRDLLRLQ